MAETRAALLAALTARLPEAVELRHRLHAVPETGNREHRTGALLADELRELRVQRVAGTGLLVRSGPARGPTVALRAELDGLALRERTGAAFAADNGNMHACGHDVHMAALTAVVRAVEDAGPPVGLLGVFQPSEEAYPSGARRIVEEGALAHHDVRAVVAVHAHPDPGWGSVAVGAGPVNASADELRIVVEGAGGHGAYPHRSRDAVVALSQVVVALQQVVSRRTDPMRAVVLSIGCVRAGSAPNALPATAEAGGILRCLDPGDRLPLREVVRDVATHAARACGCRARVDVVEGEPALVNDVRLAEATRELLPALGLRAGEALRSCGADDFGFYHDVAPVLMLFCGLGGGPGGGDRPLHHPGFLPPDEAVEATARALLAGYLAATPPEGDPR
ncbi:amidohydrolase [soil metagenome]